MIKKILPDVISARG